MSLKMYVLIRSDLSDAQQAVQAGHALVQFAREHPKEFKAWQEDSNILIYLSVLDIKWCKQVLDDGEFKHSVFREDTSPFPSLFSGCYGDTAIAVAPNWTCQYILFKGLPLALSAKRSATRRSRLWRFLDGYGS